MANRIILHEVAYHGFLAVNAIVEEVTKNKFKKAFLCTDPGLIEFGVAGKVEEVLKGAGLEYEIFSNVQANPTIENVQDGVEKFKASGADYIIAVGGGSSMDAAKAIGIIIKKTEYADVRSI